MATFTDWERCNGPVTIGRQSLSPALHIIRMVNRNVRMTTMDEKSMMDGPLLAPEFLRRLETLELVSKKMLAGRMKGDRLSKRKGRGSEFADFRPYCVGDDLRF